MCTYVAYYLKFLPIKYEFIFRKIIFFSKCAPTENAIVSVCYNSIGSGENEYLCNEYKNNCEKHYKMLHMESFPR